MATRPSAILPPEAVRAWRARLAFTQAQAAESIGISWSQMQKLELGTHPVPVTVALAMAAVEAGLAPLGEAA